MSYDMWFECPCCGNCLEEVNITYNHAPAFKELFGKDGIRSLYGKPAHEVASMVKIAARDLMDIEGAEQLEEGWEPTKLNAMLTLLRLYTAASKAGRNTILDGD